MDNLKKMRNELLALHRTLMDLEREKYEDQNGGVSNMALLNLLFENPDFVWLRSISTLVADIDELYAAKDGVDPRETEKLLARAKALVNGNEEISEFSKKYSEHREANAKVAIHHNNLTNLAKTD